MQWKFTDQHFQKQTRFRLKETTILSNVWLLLAKFLPAQTLFAFCIDVDSWNSWLDTCLVLKSLSRNVIKIFLSLFALDVTDQVLWNESLHPSPHFPAYGRSISSCIIYELKQVGLELETFFSFLSCQIQKPVGPLGRGKNTDIVPGCFLASLGLYTSPDNFKMAVAR